MEISPHIVDAIHTTELPLPEKRRRSRASPRKPPGAPYLSHSRSAQSSADDLSTTSDSSVQEHEYQTDFTSQPSSDLDLEDMQPDDVEDFRDREYPQLKGKTYLDHGGTTLYARSLVEEFSADLIANLYGNPHSASTPSAVAGHRIDAIRERALRFFGADPEHFDLVFVANATAAIKLVIDCFKDYASSTNTPVWYGYHRDAHTSLVGVRETTKMHRCFTSDEEVDIWISSGGFGGPRSRQLGLFAYPGQSNMTGRRLPLSWSGRIRKSFHKAATYTLLDAAALATTAPLDLSDPNTSPDFVALSFYKIFGFPNLGALIVRKDSAQVLQSRRYFGGGTVEMVITLNDTWHAKKDTNLHDRLEDGTLPFHNIFALDHAMNVHERLYGPNPMKFISHHTAQLGKMLYDELSSLKHHNGAPLAVIYKDDVAVYGDPSLQGATIAFNVLTSDGQLVGYADVEEAADARQIFVRSGSLCNPGGMAKYLQWSGPEMRAAYASGHRCTHPTQVMLGKATGVVRVSLGAMSTATDVRTLVSFLQEVYVDGRAPATVASHILKMSHNLQINAGTRPGSPNGPSSPTHPPSVPVLTAAAAILSNKDAVIPDSPTFGPASAPMLPPAPILTALSPPVTSMSVPSTPALASTPIPEPLSDLPANTSNLPPEPRPRFNPADYTKRHRPWEEELRRQRAEAHAAAQKGESLLDDTSTFRTTNTTPSVKARKFGRSVVNLLRTKSHMPEPRPPLPSSPLPHEFHHHAPSLLHSHRSRRSSDKLQIQSNIESLGM